MAIVACPAHLAKTFFMLLSVPHQPSPCFVPPRVLLGLGEAALEHAPERRDVHNRDVLERYQTEQVPVRAHHVMCLPRQGTLEEFIIPRITALSDRHLWGNTSPST